MTCLLQLEGVAFPHDFAFGTLPAEHVTTSVPVVVYVTETPTSTSRTARLHRFVLATDGWSADLTRSLGINRGLGD
jgi:hypothetical protein